MTNRAAPRAARRAHRELPGRAGSAPAGERSGDKSAAGASAAEDDFVLYTPAQAAALLAVKESWLRRKAGQRAIPCTFVGKHLRFSTHDLRAITALGAQPVVAHRDASRQRRRGARPPNG
jgi:excisionase family DNA binding protein